MSETSTRGQGTPEVGEGTARAARNVVVVAAGELAGKVATLVFSVVAARELGPAGFGAFSYALALGLLLATVPSWGFDSVLLRRGSADRADLGPALAQTLALRGILSVPVVLAGVLAALLGRPSPEARLAVVMVLVACLADTFSDAARNAAGALEKRGRTAVVLVVQRLATAVLAIALLAAGAGLIGVCAAYLASSLGAVLLNARVLRRLDIAADWRSVDRTALARMWRTSFVLGIDTLVAMALFRLDVVLLGIMDGDEAVASYSVAYRLLETVLFLTWAVTRATFPAMARAGRDGDVVAAVERGFAVIAAVFVPYGVLLVVEGRGVLELLFGAEYLDQSTTVLAWLAFAPLAFALAYVGSEALAARSRTTVLLISSLIAAVVNVVGNLLLIPVYSSVGAAAMTLVAFALEGTIVMVFVSRSMGLVRLDRALRVPVAAALPMAGLLLALDSSVLVEIAVGSVVYAALYVPLAAWLAPEQLAVVRRLVRR